MTTPLLYLAGIAAAELVTILASPLAGVVLHAFLLLTLVAHASYAAQHPTHKLYLALSLAPLVRILSLSMPLGGIPILYWYAIIAVPLLTASFLCIRRLGYRPEEVGLTLRRLPLQVVVGLIGLPLGVVEYVIIKPQPLAESFTFGALWLPVLILVVGTGFTEELIFRGVMQKAALERMRGWGLVYTSVVFALLHTGYYSAVELVFVLSVALFFAWVALVTRSILGVTLAHGLLNSALFLFIPLWAASFLPLENVELPDLNFSSLAPGVITRATPTPSALTITLIPTMTPIPRWAVVANTQGLGVSLLQSPRLSAEVVKIWPEGTSLELMGEEVEGEGYAWSKVRDSSGNVGWVTSSYLRSVASAPPATPTATPTPTPPRTPRPSLVVVSNTGVRGADLRRGPSLSDPVLKIWPEGTSLEWLGEEARGDGYTWWKVRDSLGNAGWIASDYLRPIAQTPATTPTPSPTATPSPGELPPAELGVYTVQPGDTLFSIAQRFGTTVETLMTLNGLRDRNFVFTGQRLLVPIAARPRAGQ